MVFSFIVLCMYIWSEKKRMKRKQTVVVTGGASGLGLALVRQLIARGHTVYIFDIVKPPVSLTGCAGNLVVDLAAPESELWITKYLSDKPEIDTLICNAGVFKFASLLTLSESEICTAFQTNVFGVIRCFKACMPSLKFYVISSEGVCLPLAACTWPYIASKRLLEDFATTLRLELHTLPTVTVVRPGAIETPMLASVELETGAIHKLTRFLAYLWKNKPEAVALKIVDSIEMVDSPDVLHVGHNPLLFMAKVLPDRFVRLIQGMCMSMLS